MFLFLSPFSEVAVCWLHFLEGFVSVGGWRVVYSPPSPSIIVEMSAWWTDSESWLRDTAHPHPSPVWNSMLWAHHCRESGGQAAILGHKGLHNENMRVWLVCADTDTQRMLYVFWRRAHVSECAVIFKHTALLGSWLSYLTFHKSRTDHFIHGTLLSPVVY